MQSEVSHLAQTLPRVCATEAQIALLKATLMRPVLLLVAASLASPSLAQEATPPVSPAGPPSASSSADLAQQLANPIASLISLPIQNNFEWGYGLDGDGFRYTANIQPVVPVPLSSDWNLISRTILPVIAQNDVTGPGTSQFGLGDVVQSLFFSPAKPTASGIVWGAGPVFLVPTATDQTLGGGKWGVGPTGVILKIAGQFTYGALANHIWSIAGKDSRGDISATFFQPFLSYTTKSATTWTIQTETTYDWLSDQWSVPIAGAVGQLVVVGKQPISLAAGVRYWVASPTGGPDWGLRFSVAFLFPK